MSWLFSILAGAALVLIAQYVAPMPRPLNIILYIVGWLLILLGILILLAFLLHVPFALAT